MKLKCSFIFFVVILLWCMDLSAQKTKATLTFKDGSKKTGYAKLIGAESVKFKSKKNAKATKYHFSELSQAKINDAEGYSVYVYLKVIGKEKRKILKQVEVGKVSLYALNTQKYTASGYTGGNSGVGTGYVGTNFYTIKNSYVRREGEIAVTHLGSNQLFIRNFKKAASDFFKDCSALTQKIKNNQFKKKDLKKIVAFYNKRCE